MVEGVNSCVIYLIPPPITIKGKKKRKKRNRAGDAVNH
jgi:hypothetical protein